MARPNIAVVDYHKGNLLSVVRSLTDVGAHAQATDDPALIRAADAVVVPGVGAFEDCMDYLRSSGEADAIIDAAQRGVPFLGICLGLHVLFERGEERSDGTLGEWVDGLGILSGSVTHLEPTRLKVPHVGWDQLHLTPHGRDCALYRGVTEGANVYFTHSYALADDVDDAIVATRSHYTRSFASGVWSDNVYGVQFHPEKSSATGLTILRNFVQLV
ncbi:MAG: imidazole glycerol phosphate synthase subunit HisH [Atopobiaceae bacterium]|jgi:glutamine amidotransferase|nr:imidazole glycerol phosphate synthase subunit HisH [Atopobiaceae bacterium]